jgi:8-oxo-dGTP diphosphatase
MTLLKPDQASVILSTPRLKHEKIIGTSVFFINDANQILLLLRDNDKDIPFPNCWDTLGGHVEPGETPLECIIREMEEEIHVKLDSPALFNVYDLSDRIECSYWQKANLDIEKIELGEGQRLKWFTEKEIQAMTDDEMAYGFKPIILEFFGQKPYKEQSHSLPENT